MGTGGYTLTASPERSPGIAPDDGTHNRAHDRARHTERSYLRFVGVGIQFAMFLVLPTLLGIWLDGHFHASPVLTIVGFLLGFAAGTWNLLHTNFSTGSDSGPDDRTTPPDRRA
ncbi:MAG TPA: AtpZ/AtpI family protein [Actinomycetota bacterium]|nr:AtpZ/AtpI family protein [Actinomycetota bacterium]